ncbi:histone-lysine N-methyltransferase SUVR4-like [Impatiens glandulifera]|uniref:histone-lysine N-methyltransferase SUVR4-like n=1 Tax=Impatiens glandulifera TaxID=253017 RepID=UPI001FB084E8|nr:histone-lysine N-methyltransferase SUVR4-like [Impatiens glandulifera]
MTPNSRVVKASNAMRNLGVSEEKIMFVLEKLLKLYDKNWQLIEEDNYRVLADAIFERDETPKDDGPNVKKSCLKKEEIEDVLFCTNKFPRNNRGYISKRHFGATTSSTIRNKGKQPSITLEDKKTSSKFVNSAEICEKGNVSQSIEKSHDISKGQEAVVITLVNEINDEPPPTFRYISKNVIYDKAYVNFSLARIDVNSNSCATCHGNCVSSFPPCECARETRGDFAYNVDGIVKEDFIDQCISMNRFPEKHNKFYCKGDCPLEKLRNDANLEDCQCRGHLIKKFIKECWWKCGCNKQCGNRVVQRGININLQVFMTPEVGKGWGLRTLQDLPKGTFVCEYVGEILTNAELYERVLAKKDGEVHTYPVLLDADWGSEGVLKDEEALCLDATYYGNIARFINHRCFDSNLLEIPVEVETPDHHYYHLAFFTSREVKAMEELNWDYGIDFDDHEHPVKAFNCRCGSKSCRNIKPKRSKFYILFGPSPKQRNNDSKFKSEDNYRVLADDIIERDETLKDDRPMVKKSCLKKEETNDVLFCTNNFPRNNHGNVSESIEKRHDISKGQEAVLITLENEINNEPPPTFHYISKNVINDKAYVNFSLARIDDNSNNCATCHGNCVSSFPPCECAGWNCKRGLYRPMDRYGSLSRKAQQVLL